MFWKRLKEVLKLRDYMKNDDEILKKAWEQHLHISNKIRETYDTEGINDLVLKAIALADERAREEMVQMGIGFKLKEENQKAEFEKMIDEDCDISFIKNFKPILTEEDFLEWFRNYRELRLKELRQNLWGVK